METTECGGGSMNRIDAFRERVASSQTLPNRTKIRATSINLDTLVLLLETFEAADALMEAIDDEGDIPAMYWRRLGIVLGKLAAEEA